MSRSGARVRARFCRSLDVCPSCGERFVYPVTWAESGPDHWWLLLRCGACETWRDVVSTNQEVADFDRALDEGMGLIRSAADRLDRERALVDAATLRTALADELLTADDFR